MKNIFLSLQNYLINSTHISLEVNLLIFKDPQKSLEVNLFVP